MRIESRASTALIRIDRGEFAYHSIWHAAKCADSSVSAAARFRLHVVCPCDNLNNCPGLHKGEQRSNVPERRLLPPAGVAQSVEHLICNQRVGGSIPFASSRSIDSGNRKGLRGDAR
jgi:hypothetical protein